MIGKVTVRTVPQTAAEVQQSLDACDAAFRAERAAHEATKRELAEAVRLLRAAPLRYRQSDIQDFLARHKES